MVGSTVRIDGLRTVALLASTSSLPCLGDGVDSAVGADVGEAVVVVLRAGFRLAGCVAVVWCEAVVFGVVSVESVVTTAPVVWVAEVGLSTCAPGVDTASEVTPGLSVDDDDVDDDGSGVPVSAQAGTDATADPIPNAIANAPTRPTYLADPTVATPLLLVTTHPGALWNRWNGYSK